MVAMAWVGTGQKSGFTRLTVTFLLTLYLFEVGGHSFRTKRQFDDAVVVSNPDSGPASIAAAVPSDPDVSSGPSSGVADSAITPGDGPSPSVLGAMDNIFKAIKDFDQYHCLERMMCEYMQAGSGDEAATSSELDTILSFLPSLTGFSSGPSSATTGSSSSLFQQGGGRPPLSGPVRRRPPQAGGGFRRGPNRAPPRRSLQLGSSRPDEGALQSLLGGLLGKRRRRKRQIQDNIVRLLQVTGLDSLHAFPYVKAALMGQANQDNRATNTRGGGVLRPNRRGQSCAALYRECPTDPDRILDYINNHNGGLVNQVQPSVDNEVGSLVSSIVSEAIQNSDILGGAGGASSPASSLFGAAGSGSLPSGANGGGLNLGSLFDTGDKVLTQTLLQGASGYIGGTLSSLAQSLTGRKR